MEKNMCQVTVSKQIEGPKGSVCQSIHEVISICYKGSATLVNGWSSAAAGLLLYSPAKSGTYYNVCF
jgi:hypothetical protein